MKKQMEPDDFFEDEKQNTDLNNSDEKTLTERRSRRAEEIGRAPQEKLSDLSEQRRRDKETAEKMRVLWVILFILVALLIAAAVYEIVLGNGSKETGAMRMSETVTESDVLQDEDEMQDKETEEEEDSLSDDEQDSLSVDEPEDVPEKHYVAGNDGSDGSSPVVTLAGLGT